MRRAGRRCAGGVPFRELAWAVGPGVFQTRVRRSGSTADDAKPRLSEFDRAEASELNWLRRVANQASCTPATSKRGRGKEFAPRGLPSRRCPERAAYQRSEPEMGCVASVQLLPWLISAIGPLSAHCRLPSAIAFDRSRAQLRHRLSSPYTRTIVRPYCIHKDRFALRPVMTSDPNPRNRPPAAQPFVGHLDQHT